MRKVKSTDRMKWVETDENHPPGAIGSLLLRKLLIKLTIVVDSELVEPASGHPLVQNWTICINCQTPVSHSL